MIIFLKYKFILLAEICQCLQCSETQGLALACLENKARGVCNSQNVEWESSFFYEMPYI